MGQHVNGHDPMLAQSCTVPKKLTQSKYRNQLLPVLKIPKYSTLDPPFYMDMSVTCQQILIGQHVN